MKKMINAFAVLHYFSIVSLPKGSTNRPRGPMKGVGAGALLFVAALELHPPAGSRQERVRGRFWWNFHPSGALGRRTAGAD
jgi:hypothetical protein